MIEGTQTPTEWAGGEALPTIIESLIADRTRDREYTSRLRGDRAEMAYRVRASLRY